MQAPRVLAILLGLALSGLGVSGFAVDAGAGTAKLSCLPKERQQALTGSGKTVGLALALKAAHARVPGEVVRAQLCEQPGGALVYMLTILTRNGKVRRLVIDAADGAFAGER